MRLDLNRLVGGRLRQTFSIAPGDPVLGGYPAEVREPIALEVELVQPSHGTYVMTGEIRGTAIEPCRRCLTQVEVDIDDRFRVIYQHGGRSEQDTGDESIVTIEPGADRIDITDQVRDRLFVETEPYAVCMEQCRGICPVCGVNRNRTTCECEMETSESRWHALEALRRSGGE